ncbi:hypothetical protein CYLTODRAFT_348516 [Cylindrobasidium torrendii FP15055 ss-10]|uniref:NTF2-like protein n=1 Tax=Cylindrobasidium torrendii FP15055 ss-10 TaxID=1314674 RepID=A0A0D7BHQ6_9AGAR|nr:hypothetical protein CYLTODRAFT_348516 [Cylindrobasidium torrendii FP15055 ss-10]
MRNALYAWSYTGEPPATLPIPTIFHLPSNSSSPANSIPDTTIYKIQESTSPYFVLPQTESYVPTAAAVAHSRNIPFWRKHLGGPNFPLEEIWDEHAYFEFEIRSVARTMGTMVAEPYVNHIPTMTGGIGRKALTEFYRDHFIFVNPPDTTLESISRTVGADRLVDEFIFHTTHTKMIDWLIPGVPPTGKKLSIPMLGVINIRGDRLYHEHIWWDQATVLLQAGILPSHVAYPSKNSPRNLRLPVAGVESANLLRDETDGKSNEMLEWGVEE